MNEAPRADCPSAPCYADDRGTLSRQMDVDRQMLITAERDGYFGLRAKPALGHSRHAAQYFSEYKKRGTLVSQSPPSYRTRLALARLTACPAGRDHSAALAAFPRVGRCPRG